MSAAESPPDSTIVIDSSVLFAMGGPTNEKCQAFERFVRRRNITVRVPQRVAEELGESPDDYGYQRDRLEHAREAGWLESATIDFSIPRVSTVVDKTRHRMQQLSADDVTEDQIEKTDTVLAGLAYQYASNEPRHVTVLVSDRVAHRAIEDVLTAVGVDDRTQVVEGRAFLQRLLSESTEN
ncbi:hypothetical protein [Halopiger goleimassiliensis]|uniref:hypothetical protein n=1 Tax=Halopiger goleimassiliensis TaxID=1293048 RepID=UPI000677A1D0|nr:hypothetical protein [Halopiger goleimassiliensis]